MRKLVAAFAGFVFGVGLLVSGMTDPAKVRGFLDLFGHWDPSLAFVMIGAIGVHALGLRLVKRPVFTKSFDAPPKSSLDARLILGAATFGVGWGLSGVCPGPAIVAMGSLGVAPIAFVLSMIAGMSLTHVPRALRVPQMLV